MATAQSSVFGGMLPQPWFDAMPCCQSIRMGQALPCQLLCGHMAAIECAPLSGAPTFSGCTQCLRARDTKPIHQPFSMCTNGGGRVGGQCGLTA